MESYTGRQRVAAAFKKTFTDQDIKVDRIAAYPIMGQCNAQLVGASIREFLLKIREERKARWMQRLKARIPMPSEQPAVSSQRTQS